MPIPPTLTERAPAAAIRGRRGLGSLALHAPQAVRALVRGDELFLVLLAGGLGAAAGLLVVGMNQSSQWSREVLYHLAPEARLSAQTSLVPWRALAVPCLGGLCMGLFTLALARWMPRRTVDPIEANALYGGRMSLRDSVVVVLQTLLSSGVGASVGLEAGYTQIGSAVGRESAGRFACGGPICACWSAAVRPARSPPPSMRR